MRSATRTSACVFALAAFVPAALAQPENDACSDAHEFSGLGWSDFDNSRSTTDGMSNGECCTFAGCDIYNDVWFCWTATESGYVAVQTCDLTSLDTRIAVYNGCSCPGGTGIIACNDDWCFRQSRVEWFAEAHQEYLIRLGSFNEFYFGSGYLEIISNENPCPPDLDRDGSVNLQDLATLLAHFGSGGALPENGDLDADTDVDLQDLASLLAEFGTLCR